MTLSEIIAEYRTQHGLSQRQFAAQCGLSNGYISLLEKQMNPKTGKPVTPSLINLKKIAQGLHTSLDDILTMADDIEIDLSKKPALDGEGGSLDGIFEVDSELEEIFDGIRRLSPSNRAKCAELVRLFLADQDRSGGI